MASLDARKARLGEVLEDVGTKTLKYLYDFGDGWEHTIKIERLADPEPGVLYPRLIEANGRCPPEDIGGPWGYAEFLEAIGDPKHERHAEFTEWIGRRLRSQRRSRMAHRRSRRARKTLVAKACRQAAAPRLNRGPHRLSITHNSGPDDGTQLDVSEARHAAPHDRIAGRRIVGAGEITTEPRDLS